jgi:hypothetical protein
LQFGWVDKNGLVPVYFDGQTSSDFLQDLLCTCKGKTLCSKDCVCFLQNFSCTELCPCQGNFSSNNSNTHTFTDDSDEEVDTFLLLNMTLAVSQLSLYVFCSCGCF